VRTLIARGEKVLITSYTHSAVDNLLDKLRDSGLQPALVARIGSLASIKDDLRHYVMGYEYDPAESKLANASFPCISLLSDRVARIRVVLCTVLTSSNHSILQNMSFDWCVIDECGQITQPASIGPLLLSRKFLLVGDEYQLPPIVLSPEAQQGVRLS
jgi:DNA replication ATP-dependent helicase Dna2